MDFKELVFVILLISLFNFAESLPRSSRSNHAEEYTDESWSAEQETEDPVQGKNETEDLSGGGFTRRSLELRSDSQCYGPQLWAEMIPTCSGHRQSPININLARSLHLNTEYNLIMKNYNKLPTSMTLMNTGRTVSIKGQWNSGERPYIKGGILKGNYVFQEIQFYWGATIYEPSNHLINGYSFPLEMHLVHYKESYGTIESALTHADGLAVIAYVFEPEDEDNSYIQDIIDELPNVLNPPDAPVSLTPFKISNMAPRFSKDFATYKGSLTTPTCDEIVTWIVYLKPLSLGCNQVDGFRQIYDPDDNLMIRNFRPIQKLHGRKVFLVSKYYFY